MHIHVLNNIRDLGRGAHKRWIIAWSCVLSECACGDRHLRGEENSKETEAVEREDAALKKLR